MCILKKLLIVYHKEEKKLRIVLLFTLIKFVIIVISLDLTKKVTDLEYLFIFQI